MQERMGKASEALFFLDWSMNGSDTRVAEADVLASVTVSAKKPRGPRLRVQRIAIRQRRLPNEESAPQWCRRLQQ